MEYSSSFLEKLTSRFVEYMSNDLSFEGLQKEILIEEVETLEFLDISTMIDLNGFISGTIALSVSKELSLKIVEKAVYGGLDENQLKELASENLAETLNIVLGNILVQFDPKDGRGIEISTPRVFEEKIVIEKTDNNRIYLCKLTYKDEEIILSYFE